MSLLPTNPNPYTPWLLPSPYTTSHSPNLMNQVALPSNIKHCRLAPPFRSQDSCRLCCAAPPFPSRDPTRLHCATLPLRGIVYVVSFTHPTTASTTPLHHHFWIFVGGFVEGFGMVIRFGRGKEGL